MSGEPTVDHGDAAVPAAADVSGPVIPVACGVLVNDRGEVLIAQRPEGKIAAGKWEFPGGKIEPGESPEQSLRRELDEELAVRVVKARPLIRIRHAYSDRTVILHTWLVTAFDGEPQGREQQAFAWVRPESLLKWDLLGADGPIVTALRLPSHYVFTPPNASLSMLLERLDGLPPGALLRLRQPVLSDEAYAQRARQLLPACRASGLRLMLDRSPQMVTDIGADGWHATERALEELNRRPLPSDRWFAVSAHSRGGLDRARQLSADLAVLGSVLPTTSHPGAVTLRWQGFSEAAAESGLPVYAIGGLGPRDAAEAYRFGGQGVAGISAYW